MPLITIFVPLYNAEAYIEQTLQSISNQTFRDFEVIVLDDQSKDDSYNKALTIAKNDERIQVLKNEKNLGMMPNWIKGIGLCHSKYFVKLDADDLWHPRLLEEAVPILENNANVGMVFVKYHKIDENGNQIPNSEIEIPDFAKNKAFSCISLVQQGAHKMLEGQILEQGVALMRNEIFKKFGNYRNIRSGDTELYFRVGCHYDIFYIDKTYYYYRVHPQSDSTKRSQEELWEFSMYEVKNEIMSYYFKHKKISKQIYQSSMNDTLFRYNTYLIYKYRTKKQYLGMIKLMLQNFMLNPIRFFKFYASRIFSKNDKI